MLIQLHTVVSRRRRSQLYSTAMRACVNTVSLTAVCVIACFVNLAPVVAECTRRHDDVSVLTMMVTRLQHSMDQLSNSVEQQQKQLTKLEDILAKQNECMYYLITTTATSHSRVADASTAANAQLLRIDRVSESDMHYSGFRQEQFVNLRMSPGQLLFSLVFHFQKKLSSLAKICNDKLYC